MIHRIRSVFWAIWYIIFRNSFDLQKGYLFIRSTRVKNADSKNGVTRISLAKSTK